MLRVKGHPSRRGLHIGHFKQQQTCSIYTPYPPALLAAGFGEELGQVRSGDKLFRWPGLQIGRQDFLRVGSVGELGLL